MTKVNTNDAVIADPVQRLAAQVIKSAIADAGAGDETAPRVPNVYTCTYFNDFNTARARREAARRRKRVA